MLQGKVLYKNSYGAKTHFNLNEESLGTLNEREIKHVIPEMLEIINRVRTRAKIGGNEGSVTEEAISFELGVKIGVVRSAVGLLIIKGLLAKDEKEYNLTVVGSHRSNWPANVYKILRNVKEEDYVSISTRIQ